MLVETKTRDKAQFFQCQIFRKRVLTAGASTAERPPTESTGLATFFETSLSLSLSLSFEGDRNAFFTALNHVDPFFPICHQLVHYTNLHATFPLEATKYSSWSALNSRKNDSLSDLKLDEHATLSTLSLSTLRYYLLN